MLTYADLLDHAVHYVGGGVDKTNLVAAKRAVLAAYDEAAARHDWSFYRSYRRLTTSAQYITGTIDYNPATREVTLTGGTWPDWAAYGQLRISDSTYQVKTRTSNTVIVLDPATPLPSDFPDDSGFTLVRDVYPLDADVVKIDHITSGEFGWNVGVMGAGELAAARRRNSGPGRPRGMSVSGYLYGIGLYLWPAPDMAYSLDFMVKRRPSALTVDRSEVGTASITTGTNTVTGSGTSFDGRLVGTVIRFGQNAKDAVTGPSGATPAVVEGIVQAVASATSLTLEQNAGRTVTGVKYCCSSRADVDEFVLGRYILREVERQTRLVKRMETTKIEQEEYLRAKLEARENDSRYTGPRAAGLQGWYPMRLRDYPPNGDFTTV